jgi:aminoglycoside phosphotransferase family enzyme/predicted kinase
MPPFDDQIGVIALLMDPATHGGVVPERIDTHISTVFLAGERALKLKKAVRLPFLDFSTLEARRAACEAEVALNRQTAPGLYLGVVAVTRRADGSLALDGGGEAIDYLVAMRRFETEGLFDRMARRSALDRRLIEDSIEAVVRFHRGALVRADRGGSAGLTWTVDTNQLSMEAQVPAILPANGVARLAELSRAALARLAPLLDERRARGLVRRCHGDLHLGNICMFEGRPTLFDAIEFSEDIACIDVFYDIAFLLMDLDVHGARPLASIALNHALDLTGDYQAVAALPLFLSLRAGVRCHVAATIAAAAQGDEAARRAAEAQAYLKAALDYLAPAPARLVAVGGLSGSGKSRMGRRLAPLLAAPGAVVVRSDALRKQLTGVGLKDRLGPEGYTPEVTARTYRAMLDTCAMLLKAGHPVIADAVFAKPEQRADVEAVARAAGVPSTGCGCRWIRRWRARASPPGSAMPRTPPPRCWNTSWATTWATSAGRASTPRRRATQPMVPPAANWGYERYPPAPG